MTDIQTFDDARAAVAAGASTLESAAALVATLTPEERLWMLDGDGPTWGGLHFLNRDGYHKAPFVGAEIDRVGIPGVRFADGPRGAVVGNATAFPVSMARGATWDPALEERIGAAIGAELRAAGATLTGAVCVNLLRHPAWGRAQETYGEEPLHVGELGAALTRGLQQSVMACVKHFACNSMENARFSVDIEVDEVTLHEIYLPHFKRIIDEGVAAVMSAYNSVNGEWCGESPALLTDVLRTEWGFAGYVISDWIFGLRDAVTSLSAGLDIEMPYRMVRMQHLPAALESGAASWADVDRAATCIVDTLLRFDAVLSAPNPDPAVVGSDDHRALAREVASRSVVLLRNEDVGGAPVLPLDPGAGRIAVLGRLADVVNLGDGGSSDVWDLDCTTILDGVQAVFDDVVHADGADVDDAVGLAAGAAVALVVVGYTAADEGEYIGATDPSLPAMFPKADEPEVVARFESFVADIAPITKPERLGERAMGFSVGGDRSSLRLPDDDVALIRAVAAANPRTIVAIQAGSAVIMTEWIDDVAGVVQPWYGGCQAGPGLVDVLTGAVNPSARLPFTVPYDEDDLPDFDRDATTFTYGRWHGWRHLEHEDIEPAFAFGFGLSYTTFAVRDVDAAVLDDAIVVTGALANTGARDGADVVQVYAELPDLDAPRRLVGFARIEVAAGATEPFVIRVTRDDLATRDPELHAWVPAAGTHVLEVGRYVGDADAYHLMVDLPD